MKKTDCLFIDKVNGREVFRWIDKYGNFWLAQSRFGLRVNQNNQINDEFDWLINEGGYGF